MQHPTLKLKDDEKFAQKIHDSQNVDYFNIKTADQTQKHWLILKKSESTKKWIHITSPLQVLDRKSLLLKMSFLMTVGFTVYDICNDRNNKYCVYKNSLRILFLNLIS